MQTAANQVTVIVTVRNEGQNIAQLLTALAKQTHQPYAVIIADGGSSDDTVSKLAQSTLRPRIMNTPGNRSVGRNAAIQAAQTPLIAITDAGCIPDVSWLAELVTMYQKSGAPVVAGYYYGLPKTPFEEAVVPYALVMPNAVDEQNFLPATRSMLLEKSVWESVGGFDETLSDNEDFAFAHAIKTAGYTIAFCKVARVGWMPRSSIASFWTMIFRFARGDAAAGLWRPKVGLIFLRYSVAFMITYFLFATLPSGIAVSICVLLGVLYGGWSIQKNVQSAPHGWYWLPVLQVVSDWAVMLGTAAGLALLSRSKLTAR